MCPSVSNRMLRNEVVNFVVYCTCTCPKCVHVKTKFSGCGYGHMYTHIMMLSLSKQTWKQQIRKHDNI